MTHEEVLDEVNVIYERISQHSKDYDSAWSDGNYTEALEILIDYYEVGLIEELEKIKGKMTDLEKLEDVTFIKCNIMLRDNEIKEYREKFIKQMDDGVVVLPAGFELARVDVDMLEKIKLEIEDFYGTPIRKSKVFEIIDKYIEELKGNSYQKQKELKNELKHLRNLVEYSKDFNCTIEQAERDLRVRGR